MKLLLKELFVTTLSNLTTWAAFRRERVERDLEHDLCLLSLLASDGGSTAPMGPRIGLQSFNRYINIRYALATVRATFRCAFVRLWNLEVVKVC